MGRTHGPHACRTHVLRAPGADPGHPGGRVVGAIDQYVSTTSIIISRGPQLVRKAVLMLTSRGVKDVLWRARAAPSRFREARAGPRRAASAARAAARRRRQARRGEALRRGGRGGRCRTAEARATRGAAATPLTASARAAAAQAVALPRASRARVGAAAPRVCRVLRGGACAAGEAGEAGRAVGGRGARRRAVGGQSRRPTVAEAGRRYRLWPPHAEVGWSGRVPRRLVRGGRERPWWSKCERSLSK